MTTTATRDAAITRATLPYALSGVANHLIDHQLPAPETIEVRRGRVIIWVGMGHAAAWKRDADVRGTRHETRAAGSAGEHHLHIADLVLHGSCVVVELRWITWVDHHICDLYDDCMTALCACRDIPVPCEGRVESTCSHGQNLCPDHQGHCSECRDDRRQDRTGQ